MPVPTDISGLVAWSKADAGTTPTSDGVGISQWDDQSASGDDATQGTAADEPTYESNELNSLPVVRFSPDGDGAEYLTASGVGPISQPDTVFLVAKLASSGSRNAIDGVSARQAIYTSTNNLRIYAGSNEVTIGTDLWGDNAYHIITVIFNGASSAVWFDQASQTVGSNPGTSGLTGLMIGTFTSDSGGWDGDIAELVIYDSALSTGDREDIEEYLFDKWFAAPDHERSASVSATGAIATDPLLVALRSASLSATAAISASPEGSAPPTFTVREKPPLRLHLDVENPSGRRYRWGHDEPDPANVPMGLRFGDSMPGGFDTLDCTLARNPNTDYPDLERLSTIRVLGPGGDIAGEYRMEAAPRASGEQMAVSPRAVGWQAALEDDKSAVLVPVDRDASRWGDMSLERKQVLAAAGETLTKIQGSAEGGGLVFDVPNEALTAVDRAELHYEMPAGVKASAFGYRSIREGTWSILTSGLFASDTRPFTAAEGYSLTADDTLREQALTDDRRYLLLQVQSSGSGTPPAGTQESYPQIAVYDDSGITRVAVEDEPDGVLASGIVAYAVSRWAPTLNFTEGRTLLASSFPVPHVTFHEPTTAGEIVRQATRWELQDWAVWEGKTFWWYPRNTYGNRWRARIRPSQLQTTGQQVERLWNSILVQYNDPADGATRTVGPVGSGADTTSEYLTDSDPDNPANRLGITRRDLLQAGTTTANGAVEIGRQFLEQSKLLDGSGQARFVGWVEDDRGVTWPYWKVRAGDYVSFIDAADSGYRRIVKSDKDHGSRTCTIDIDAPPEGLAALLERLGAVLIPLGL